MGLSCLAASVLPAEGGGFEGSAASPLIDPPCDNWFDAVLSMLAFCGRDAMVGFEAV